MQYTTAKPLNTPDLPWFTMYYLNNMAEAASPGLNPVSANLTGLPKITIIGAELDPLQIEGKQLADKLTAADVANTYKFYTGGIHEFFWYDYSVA